MVGFLFNVLDGDVSPKLSIIALVLRKVSPSVELVEELGGSGFLDELIALIRRAKKVSVLRDFFTIFRTLAGCAYVPQYLIICPRLVKEIKANEELREIAGETAVAFARYPECVSKFREGRLKVFYEKKRNNPQFTTQAERFLAAIANCEEEDNENYDYTDDSYSSSG
jgi:hypothetical protein